jgi:putative ABC transport system permease protein
MTPPPWRLIWRQVPRNLLRDRFGTIAAILGVALGAATVNVILVIDINTADTEQTSWQTNPARRVSWEKTVRLSGYLADGRKVASKDASEETHEDYQVMRSAIRLGSLSAFLVGALIVFFTFNTVLARRRRELALLRTLGVTSGQLAWLVLAEAAFIGAVGGLLGMLATFPMAELSAQLGLTTTGRTQLQEVWFPYKRMLLVSFIAGVTALLGVLRPIRQLTRMDLRGALAGQQREAVSHHSRSPAVLWISLPFMLLLYLLMRPFFADALPSLTFFVLEAALVCLAFLASVAVVPEIVRWIGSLLGRLVPAGSAAERLLMIRRAEHTGHELAWPINGLMMVFALLLALHIATLSLKNEVIRWAGPAIGNNCFFSAWPKQLPVDPKIFAPLPPRVIRVRYSGRTLWPSQLMAVEQKALLRVARLAPDATIVEMVQRLQPKTVILSTLMARHHGIGKGDFLEVQGKGGTRRLRVVGVSDNIGYIVRSGTYRHNKTYGLIHEADFDLLRPYVAGLGNSMLFVDPRDHQWRTDGGGKRTDWKALLPNALALAKKHHLIFETGLSYRKDRVWETDRDFAVFDLVLFLTTLLAMIGVTNSLVLSVYARKRELALLRVLGMTRGQLRRLMMMEGALVGLFGGAMAVLLGVPLGYAALGALRAVSAFDVHFYLPFKYVLYVLAGAVAVSLFAALYPATRAGAVDMAASVHYE